MWYILGFLTGLLFRTFFVVLPRKHVVRKLNELYNRITDFV